MPTDFWERVRHELDAIKPVFMLAEWESRDLHAAAFDMTYAWSWNETLHRIAMGKADLESTPRVLRVEREGVPGRGHADVFRQ